MQNIFVGASDPLMGGNAYQTPNIDDKIDQLKQLQQQLELQKQNVIRSQQQPVAHQNPSPVWDEIDNITSAMSDREFGIMSNNEEFQSSQATIMSIMQREYMRIMRPIVENTKDGKDALDKHLILVKKLKKSAADEANKNLELFNEYTEKYSNMPYSEFLKMKREGAKQ